MTTDQPQDRESRELSDKELSLWHHCLKGAKPLLSGRHRSPSFKEVSYVDKDMLRTPEEKAEQLKREKGEFVRLYSDIKKVSYKERFTDKKLQPPKIYAYKIRRYETSGQTISSDDFYDLLDSTEPTHVFYPKEDRKKLGRPTLSQGRLDLHGMTLQHAFSAFQDFIDCALERSCKRVEVVTGIGKTSGGLIRKELPFWIERRDFGAEIEMLSNPNNPGSVELILRKKKAL